MLRGVRTAVQTSAHCAWKQVLREKGRCYRHVGVTSSNFVSPVGNGFSNFNMGVVRTYSTKFDQATDAYDEEDDAHFSDYDENEINYPVSQVEIGSVAPSFSGKAVVDGEITTIELEDYLGKWVVLFFYPKDFTFVCPTEIISFSDRAKEFEAINAQLIACSTDTEECHLAWTRLPRNQGGLGKMNIPILADTTKLIASKYGVLNESLGIAYRGLFLINPDGIVQQMTVNNFPVGRSVDETLRLLQAFQFVAEHGEVCPANWKPGDATMIPNPEDSMKYFASGATESTEDSRSTRVISVKTKKEFDEAVASGKPVVAKFMAPWCGKCTQIQPYVEKLAEENSKVTFLKVDTTLPELEKLKESMDVSILPTFRFFKKGTEVGEPVSGYKKRQLAEQVKAL